MLKPERFEYILEKLSAKKTVDASTLSQELRISEATVRRDLTELDALGKIRKVHGGAIPSTYPALTFQQRTHIHQGIKLTIAKKALPLLQSGQVIMIDGGTTNLQLVKLIPSDFQATIVTNSPNIAQQFNCHPQVQVIMTGGQYAKASDALVGVAACETIKNIHADVCLLGICSLHPTQGVTMCSYEEAHVKKAMVYSSRQVIALTNAEKLGKRETFKVCETGEINIIITELSPEEKELAFYQELNIQVL